MVLFAKIRNAADRIPSFLEHYRRLAVRHFVLVDNASNDALQDLVKNDQDVSLWYTEADEHTANSGMLWLNYLLRRFGEGRWCLICDPNELLVFPHCDSRNLFELAEFLENERRIAFFCVTLDMYTEEVLDESPPSANADPFTVQPYFDSTGYVQGLDPVFQYSWVKGGVRRRVEFSSNPERAPDLNKIPFVKWHWSYGYVESTHYLVPRRLNLTHSPSHVSPTGCLCRFTYSVPAKETAPAGFRGIESERGIFKHKEQSARPEDGRTSGVIYEKSERFRDWRQLEDLGLLSRGHWF